MIIRYASAVTSGIFMTLTLFYAMQSLIAMDPFDPVDTPKRVRLIFEPTIVDAPLVPTDFTSYKKLFDPIEPPPPRPGPIEGGDKIVVGHPAAPAPAPGPSTLVRNFMHDGPLVALVRVEPAYPARAAQQNLEGYVTVQFDVFANGTVGNITVVDSSHSIFERAAIRATQKFRFRARVVDGVALATRGVQNRFVFRMDRG